MKPVAIALTLLLLALTACQKAPPAGTDAEIRMNEIANAAADYENAASAPAKPAKR